MDVPVAVPTLFVLGAVVLLFLLALVSGAFLLLCKTLQLGIAPWLALFAFGALCVFVVLGLSRPRATDSGVSPRPREVTADLGDPEPARRVVVEKVAVDAAELLETLDRPAPDWVTDEASILDGGKTTVIRSGPHARILDCEQALNEELQKAVTAYVQENIEHGQGLDLSVPPEVVRDLVVVGEHVETRRHSFGDMHQIYQRLNFGREAHEQLWEWAREAVVRQRLWHASVGLGAVLLALLTVFGYLRIDDVTNGRYRRRLGWSAAALCGLVAGGTALLMTSL